MIIRTILAGIALAFALPVSAPATAQASSAQSNVYERIYDAVNAGADRSALHDSLVEAVKRSFANEAVFQALEQESPGLIEDIGDAIRPVLIGYSERVRADYRPRMVALFRETLTQEEAVGVAEFYESPIGRRMIQGVSENYRADAVLENAASGDTVTVEQVQEDTDATTAATIADLSEEERAQLIQAALANPAMAKMREMGPQMAALRAEMEEAPMTPSEEKQMEAAMGRVLKKRFPNM